MAPMSPTLAPRPTGTPAASGFVMPAEWEPHAGCLMAWPTRRDLWGGHLADAKRDYAAVAAAVAQFEPVVMVCNPGSAGEVRKLCDRGCHRGRDPHRRLVEPR